MDKEWESEKKKNPSSKSRKTTRDFGHNVNEVVVGQN